MKKICIALFVVIIFLISLSYIISYLCIKQRNENISKENLNLAYKAIDNNSNEGIINSVKNKWVSITQNNESEEIDNSIKIEGEIIGILYIPAIEIEAPIKEGTSQEIMHTSIGHFTESNIWDGNVSLASHNGGTSAHYFENIYKLNKGDTIEYKTNMGVKKYEVEKMTRIKSTDWSLVNGNDGKINTITLVTCINGMPDYRLCVRANEVEY